MVPDPIVLILVTGVLVAYGRWRFGQPHSSARWIERLAQEAETPRYISNLPLVSLAAAFGIVALDPLWLSEGRLLVVPTLLLAAGAFGAVLLALRPPKILVPSWRHISSLSERPLSRFDLGMSVVLVALGAVMVIVAILVLSRP